MKITLEQEDVKWATTTIGGVGDVRWMVVTVGGKQFHVRRIIEPGYMYRDEESAKREIDKYLLKEMEVMLAKMFRDAAAAVPDGEMAIR